MRKKKKWIWPLGVGAAATGFVLANMRDIKRYLRMHRM